MIGDFPKSDGPTLLGTIVWLLIMTLPFWAPILITVYEATK